MYRLHFQCFRTRSKPNVPSKRPEINYSTTNNKNTQDINPQLWHEDHEPYCQKSFLFSNPSKMFPFYRYILFFSKIFILQMGLHSTCSRQTREIKQQPTEPNGQNGIVGPDPAITRRAPISPEVCRSQKAFVVHTATRANNTSPIVVYYSSSTLAIRFNRN
jgi:hypothetical protein